MRDIGWLFEEEELLFFALDSQGEGEARVILPAFLKIAVCRSQRVGPKCTRPGVLRREDFRWLDAEFWRIRRKMEAKSRSIHSLQKMQAARLDELRRYPLDLICVNSRSMLGGFVFPQLFEPTWLFSSKYRMGSGGFSRFRSLFCICRQLGYGAW